MEKTTSDLFTEAASYDPSIRTTRRQMSELQRRRVLPVTYSRRNLYAHMAKGKPIICSGYPCPINAEGFESKPSNQWAGMRAALKAVSTRATYRIFTGRTGQPHRATLADILKRWERGRSIFGVTDLHIRDTKMEQIIDPDILSHFNLLCLSTAEAYEQEMFSFVISTRGHVTDSHSDDPDSSNYCFTGCKLWLMWDTFEGLGAGLEDVERCAVHGTASFDMKRFLSLKSSLWCLVEDGQTLFLPGHYTHKVITLRKYIGVGGFYVSLPNCLRSLARWHVHSPLWMVPSTRGRNNNVLNDISKTACRKVRQLRRASGQTQERWGLDYLPIADKSLRREYSMSQINELLRNKSFNTFVRVAGY